jgi:hypothetical protein
MKSARSFLIAVFAFGIFFAGTSRSDLAAQTLPRFVTISGSVVDDETGTPIEGANVFIASSLLGAATDTEGGYQISGVPLGTHEVVVSILGFEGQSEQVRIADGRDFRLDFRLKPRVYQTGEIEIVAARTREDEARLNELQTERALNLKKFEKFFLGVSPNAERCELLNPEVLRFEADDESQTFVAHAGDALLIENRALGYRVRFLLEEFEVREEQRTR